MCNCRQMFGAVSIYRLDLSVSRNRNVFQNAHFVNFFHL